MKNKLLVFSITALLLLSFLTILPSVGAEPNGIVYVDDDADPSWYNATHVKTIQEGIDNVSVGGTVYIWDSVYYCEGIQVNKSVSLIGNGTATTILEYTNVIGSPTILYLKADNISISGLHFNNSLPNNRQILNQNYNIGNYTHIFNCLFTNSTGETIDISPHSSIDAHNFNISNNEFYDVAVAVFIDNCNNTNISNNIIDNIDNAIYLLDSYDGNISYNTVTNSGGDGHIYLTRCGNIIIHHNILRYGLWTGIGLDSNVDNCTIHTNTITGFNETGCYGIEIYGSYDNLFYNNYFNNNLNAYDDGNNTWNTTKTLGTNIIGGPYLGGNYWSDYTGNDNDGDGLGNTNLPHNSSGAIVTGGDYLPLGAENTPPIFKTSWIEVAGQLGAETHIDSLAVYNGSLYGGTGNSGKLYRWNDTDSWVEVAGQLGAETHIYSLAVYNGSLYGGTGSGGRLFKWNDVDSWVEVAGQLDAETHIYSLAVYNGSLYGGTGSGGRLFKWNDVDSWVEVADKLGDEDSIYSLAAYNGSLYGGTGKHELCP